MPHSPASPSLPGCSFRHQKTASPAGVGTGAGKRGTSAGGGRVGGSTWRDGVAPGPGPHRPSGGAHSWSRVDWRSLGVSDAPSPRPMARAGAVGAPTASVSGRGQLRVLAVSTGRQKPRGWAQSPGAFLEPPWSLSLPDAAASLPTCGFRSQVPGVLPHLPPPRTPPATLRFLRGGKGCPWN